MVGIYTLALPIKTMQLPQHGTHVPCCSDAGLGQCYGDIQQAHSSMWKCYCPQSTSQVIYVMLASSRSSLTQLEVVFVVYKHCIPLSLWCSHVLQTSTHHQVQHINSLIWSKLGHPLFCVTFTCVTQRPSSMVVCGQHMLGVDWCRSKACACHVAGVGAGHRTPHPVTSSHACSLPILSAAATWIRRPILERS